MSALAAIERALALSLKSPGFGVTETHGHLIAVGRLDSGARTLWQEAIDGLPEWLFVTCHDEVEAERRPAELSDEDMARLTLSFATRNGAVHLFSQDGWKSYLRNPRHDFDASVVRLACEPEGFHTGAFAVEPWIEEPQEAPMRTRTEPNPRRFVRCADANLLAPAELSPWLLKGVPPTRRSPAYELWRNTACEMIAKALANELLLVQNRAKVILFGQPLKMLDLGEIDPEDQSIFGAVSEAAQWIYGGVHDQEIKHTFLTSELAREWPLSEPFYEGLSARLPNALESAKLLYKAHIRSSSKETLKALSDLRKALADEVQKVSQQTRDLASGVWKDVALALGTIAIKLTTDAAKLPTFTTSIAYVAIGVAIYIALSYWTSVRTNRKFTEVTGDIRSTWRTKLYGFLDDDDYRALATEPLQKAEQAYESTKIWTTIIVLLVVIGLVAHSAWDLGWFQYMFTLAASHLSF